MSVNYPALSISFGVITGLAVVLTLFRLGFRLKIQRFWWEDVWAAVASLCALISVTSVLVETDRHESTLIASKVKAYMYTSTIWSVRLSLIFSILRIPSSIPLRRVTFAVAASFVLFWATMLGLQAWWCNSYTETLSGDAISPSCVVPTFFVVFEVTTNVIADVITILLSIKLLWRVSLPRRQRRMILYLFTASRLLCAVSLAHSVTQLVSSQTTQGILAYLQVVVFMIVCNMVVIGTYIYRVFWSPSDEDCTSSPERVSDDDDFTTPVPRRSENLTTVDLGWL